MNPPSGNPGDFSAEVDKASLDAITLSVLRILSFSVMPWSDKGIFRAAVIYRPAYQTE